MFFFRLFFFACIFRLCAIEVDFDCVVVGTSPISMLEALYRAHIGNRVLIVEQAGECGGAWKSVDVCGIAHADLGCHGIGGDSRMRKFLEEYIGCKMASPETYPLGGCYELVHNLERLVEASGIVLLLNHKLESVLLDPAREIAEVKVNGRRFLTKKILATQASEIFLENSSTSYSEHKTKFPHLYLLIEDPTAPKFTYRHLGRLGIIRAMNVTTFVGLQGSGKQLISCQMRTEKDLDSSPEIYLNELKKNSFVDASARVLCSASYVYEQSHSLPHELSLSPFFELIQTGHIANMTSYIEKWEMALKPFNVVIPN